MKLQQTIQDLDNTEIYPVLHDYVPGKSCDTCFSYNLTSHGT
jgi:hypothetical protein